ncbi:hypothetical protein [Limnochorda pilosa]|uniref:Uncharacterized protein n=1 Tax=Limnochorda pilosa TaxID=1555112 RepID=A0A0K2SH76_LIMPI|nr:hypothetical protein [Limnochorda pilosa]BAS26473.1 hypothetical protein LIP_0616 [Limnochorda pilosa]
MRFDFHGALLLLLLMAFLAAAASPSRAQDGVRWGGEWQAAGEASFTGDGTDVRASSVLRLQAQAGTDAWRAFFDGHAVASGPVGGEDEWETRGEVDRLFLRLYLPSADVTLGRQVVNWGVGYAWAPTDFFNPPDPTDPEGIRRGVVAAAVQIPVGPLDVWSLAVAEETYGIRRRGNLRGTDWSVVAVSRAGAAVMGADAKGDWGIGWHAAAAYGIPGTDGTPSGDPPLEGLKGLIGADYSFLDGDLGWLGEYCFQTTRGLEALSEQMTFQQLTYRVDDFTSVFGSVLGDLVRGSAIWSGGASTLLGGQSELTVTASAFSGSWTPAPVPVPRARVKVQVSKAF